MLNSNLIRARKMVENRAIEINGSLALFHINLKRSPTNEVKGHRAMSSYFWPH